MLAHIPNIIINMPTMPTNGLLPIGLLVRASIMPNNIGIKIHVKFISPNALLLI